MTTNTDSRVKVATNALQIVGPPMTHTVGQAVGQLDCRTCAYEQWCADQLGPDDPSTAINVGGLSRREWLALRRMGITKHRGAIGGRSR